MLTPDSKHWVFGDAFGITRLSFGKTTRGKTTIKATAPTGALAVSADSKRLLVSGRVQTGVYGSDQLVMLSLPGLGLRLKKLRAGRRHLWS